MGGELRYDEPWRCRGAASLSYDAVRLDNEPDRAIARIELPDRPVKAIK
jgi:hypothetical protein